ncbi:MAG: AAA family ATPase [Defluviitaleaceae bacterium]|nr:AAA family ATPase [Defluviitaleaceae bacterium]
MGRIVAIANQKGGVGKTTTNINLSACLAVAGKRVLVADMDPQGNTTSGLGLDKGALGHTAYTLLLGEAYIEQAIVGTPVKNLSLIPSNVNLSGAEIELVGKPGREYILRNILLNAKYLYDYIFIDCPPSLNLLTLNALCAADSVLVPIQCEYYAMEGLSQLTRTIELVRKKLNQRLKIEGLVFTMFDTRTNLSQQVVEEVKKHMGDLAYKSIIPRSVRLSEAPSHGLPVCLYDGRSKGAEAYAKFAAEFAKRAHRNAAQSAKTDGEAQSV